MTPDEAAEAKKKASECGLLVKGVRPLTSRWGVALYVYDPLRHNHFYFSRLYDLNLHLAENTKAKKAETEHKKAYREFREKGPSPR